MCWCVCVYTFPLTLRKWYRRRIVRIFQVEAVAGAHAGIWATMGQFVDLKITLIAVCCVLLSPVQFAGGNVDITIIIIVVFLCIIIIIVIIIVVVIIINIIITTITIILSRPVLSFALFRKCTQSYKCTFTKNGKGKNV